MGSRELPSSGAGDKERLRLALAVGLGPVLRGWLPGQRWFRSKGRVVRGVRVSDAVPLDPDSGTPWLVLAEVEFAEGSPATYALLIRLGGAGADGSLGAVDAGGGVVPVHDALDDPAACQALLHRFARGGSAGLASDRLRFTRTGAFPESALALPPASMRRLGGEQSNTCVVFGDALVLKVFRQVEPGFQAGLGERTEQRNEAAQGLGVLAEPNAFPLRGDLGFQGLFLVGGRLGDHGGNPAASPDIRPGANCRLIDHADQLAVAFHGPEIEVSLEGVLQPALLLAALGLILVPLLRPRRRQTRVVVCTLADTRRASRFMDANRLKIFEGSLWQRRQ